MLLLLSHGVLTRLLELLLLLLGHGVVLAWLLELLLLLSHGVELARLLLLELGLLLLLGHRVELVWLLLLHSPWHLHLLLIRLSLHSCHLLLIRIRLTTSILRSCHSSSTELFLCLCLVVWQFLFQNVLVEQLLKTFTLLYTCAPDDENSYDPGPVVIEGCHSHGVVHLSDCHLEVRNIVNVPGDCVHETNSHLQSVDVQLNDFLRVVVILMHRHVIIVRLSVSSAILLVVPVVLRVEGKFVVARGAGFVVPYLWSQIFNNVELGLVIHAVIPCRQHVRETAILCYHCICIELHCEVSPWGVRVATHVERITTDSC